jgi:hypothetical protein
VNAEPGRSALAEAAPDDNDLLAPVRPISDDVYAAFLTRKVWTVFTALAGLEVISVGVRVFQLLNGQAWSSAVSIEAGLAFSAGYLLIIVLLLWALSRWVARRASRVGAVILAVLAVSALVNAAVRPLSEGLWLKLGLLALAGFALWFLIGVVRGAFALQGRQPPHVEPPPTKPWTVQAAVAQGRQASAPIRRVIRWIALGGLAFFLIGGGWFWWSTRDEPVLRSTSVAAMHAGTAFEPAAPATAEQPAPMVALSREMLVGVWAPAGGECVGWGSYDLRENGQVFAEAADGQWGLNLSVLVLQIRTYDMDTDVPGPVQDVGGLVEMVSRDEFRLTRDNEVVTYRRC